MSLLTFVQGDVVVIITIETRNSVKTISYFLSNSPVVHSTTVFSQLDMNPLLSASVFACMCVCLCRFPTTLSIIDLHEFSELISSDGCFLILHVV